MHAHRQVCVVGAGYWGKNHIHTLNELGALGGIVDIRSEVLHSLEEKYPNVLTFKNITKYNKT